MRIPIKVYARPLRRHLIGHSVDKAFELGRGDLRNDAPLDRAEENDYDLLITTGQSIPYSKAPKADT